MVRNGFGQHTVFLLLSLEAREASGASDSSSFFILASSSASAQHRAKGSRLEHMMVMRGFVLQVYEQRCDVSFQYNMYKTYACFQATGNTTA